MSKSGTARKKILHTIHANARKESNVDTIHKYVIIKDLVNSYMYIVLILSFKSNLSKYFHRHFLSYYRETLF